MPPIALSVVTLLLQAADRAEPVVAASDAAFVSPLHL
jgi:hypothetical protein